MERSAATFINHAVFWVMLAKNDDIDHDDGLLARVTAACIAADNCVNTLLQAVWRECYAVLKQPAHDQLSKAVSSPA